LFCSGKDAFLEVVQINPSVEGRVLSSKNLLKEKTYLKLAEAGPEVGGVIF